MSSYSDTSLSAAARHLPATSSKTPLGGSVPPSKAKPKPPVGSKPTPVKKAPVKPPVNSDPYGVMASEVNPQLQALAQLQAQQTEAQNQQRQGISQATSEFLKYLTGQPSVQNDYAQAAGQESALGSTAASFLQGQNPNDQIQAQLAKFAPNQGPQIGNALGNTFGQGAAALYGLGGLIPGSQLAENGAAAAAFQKSQAPNVALQGLQNLKQFQYGAGQDNQKLAAQKAAILASIPGLNEKAQSAAQTQNLNLQYKNAQLGLAQDRITNQAAEFTTRQRQQQSQFIQRQRQSVEEFNARQSATAQKQALPSASLSQKVGYLVDGSGKPILSSKGKRQILPGFKTQNGTVVPRSKASGSSGLSTAGASSISKIIDSWKNGKPVNVRTQTGTKKDAQGNQVPVYGSTTQATGRLNYIQAYKRLTTIYNLGDKEARAALDTAYAKGQQGRGWLTNEERAALTHAGIQNYAGKINDPQGVSHGYIGIRQKNALAQRKLLPPGQDGAVNGKPVYYIDPSG